MPVFETVTRLPLTAVQQGMRFGREVMSETVGLVLPTETPQEFVERLASERLLDRVEAAADLVRGNDSSDIPAVRQEGYTEVAELVLEAARSQFIPPETETQVVEIAAELELDPERVELPEQDTAELDIIIDTYHKVRQLPVTE